MHVPVQFHFWGDQFFFHFLISTISFILSIAMCFVFTDLLFGLGMYCAIMYSEFISFHHVSIHFVWESDDWVCSFFVVYCQ